MCRFCLLANDAEPCVCHLGSAATHHAECCNWPDPDRCLARGVSRRGTLPPTFGRMKKYPETNAFSTKDDDISAIDPYSVWGRKPHPHNVADPKFRPGDLAFF